MLQKFNKIDRPLLNKIIDFLTLSEAHSRKIQGKTYATLQYVVLAQTQFLQHCTPNDEDIPLMRAIKVKAKFLLETTIDISMEHKIAVLLWPKFKDLSKLFPVISNPEEVRKIVLKLIVYFAHQVSIFLY